MQIILMEKVANLGQLGDVVKVRNGYARNFLIPQGKAKRATPVAIAEFDVRRAELEKTQADITAAAGSQADKLNGLMVQVTRKAGMDGKLRKYVTNFGFDAPERSCVDRGRRACRRHHFLTRRERGTAAFARSARFVYNRLYLNGYSELDTV